MESEKGARPAERYYVDWRDRETTGRWPTLGEVVLLAGGRPAVVETARGPKLVVRVVGEAGRP